MPLSGDFQLLSGGLGGSTVNIYQACDNLDHSAIKLRVNAFKQLKLLWSSGSFDIFLSVCLYAALPQSFNRACQESRQFLSASVICVTETPLKSNLNTIVTTRDNRRECQCMCVCVCAFVKCWAMQALAESCKCNFWVIQKARGENSTRPGRKWARLSYGYKALLNHLPLSDYRVGGCWGHLHPRYLSRTARGPRGWLETCVRFLIQRQIALGIRIMWMGRRRGNRNPPQELQHATESHFWFMERLQWHQIAQLQR